MVDVTAGLLLVSVLAVDELSEAAGAGVWFDVEASAGPGVVTGGAGGEIEKAAAEGVDTFITGEGPHWAAVVAEDLGVNLLLAGHYATETFGVKALAEHVAGKFGLEWQFIDHPTGL